MIAAIATTSADPLAADLVEQAMGDGPFLALAGTAASVAEDQSVSLRKEHSAWTRDVVVVETDE